MLNRLLSKVSPLIPKRLLRGKSFYDDARTVTAFENSSEWKCSAFQYIYHRYPACRHQPYLWGVLEGAALAKVLGYTRVSLIEFGVAEGHGLLALEEISIQAEILVGVSIDVYGFDSGIGVPAPKDYRDMPYLWSEGFFPMDRDKLTQRLKRAHLKLGLVEDTVPEFLHSEFAPVAFISFDLDLYTSTRHALSLLEAHPNRLIPRVSCYFDDIMGGGCNEFTGERLAIDEFNAQHTMRKVALNHGLKWFVPWHHRQDRWTEMMYLAHSFDHPRYGAPHRMNLANIIDIDGNDRQR